eukprot:TRINITY_DN95397_c0_g1_i1.p1 TRINITY_DN95397_c0_g1~~TRINITY_DN95397_c0_g1_i1.p1  ORF type:complete len:197 (+),score=23.74 TRINITY_DN95397_c0_g1_i1:32-592(+)
MALSKVVYTIGHSNHTMEKFIGHLARRGITNLIDVRSFPRSARYPHFSRDTLRDSCAAANVDYRWRVRLGGKAERPIELRLEDADVRAGLQEVIASGKAPCIMCSEGYWQQCHRSVLAEALSREPGVVVRHILADGNVEDHPPASKIRYRAFLPGGALAPVESGNEETPVAVPVRRPHGGQKRGPW